MSNAIAYLDEIDTFYLANTLSIAQLRREINSAMSRAKVAEMYRGTEYATESDIWPWAGYIQCCREAIKCRQANKTKAAPSRGKIDIEAIKARNDIVDVIEGYTRLRKSGKNFTGCCPIHQDHNPSLTVYPDSQTWHCFGACGRGGDVISFIEAVESCDFKQAAAILGGA